MPIAKKGSITFKVNADGGGMVKDANGKLREMSIEEYKSNHLKLIQMLMKLKGDGRGMLMFCWDSREAAGGGSPLKTKVWKHSEVRVEHSDGASRGVLYVRKDESHLDTLVKDRRYLTDIELCRVYYGFPVRRPSDYTEFASHVNVSGGRGPYQPCDFNGDEFET